MNKLRFTSFCASVAFVASMSVHAEAEFSYDKNTFVNYDECLGIEPGSSLGLGEEVRLFSEGQSPMTAKIVHVIRAVEAQEKFDTLGFNKVHSDERLWTEIGCAHSFHRSIDESLARILPAPSNPDGLGMAIRGLPDEAWISEGIGKPIPMDAKDNPYMELVRPLVTDACYAPDSLTRVREFPVRNGHTVVQLDIGKVKKVGPEVRKQKLEEEMQEVERGYAKWAWPEYKKKKMKEWARKDFVESVEICRFFLTGKRILKAETISRRTGVDERVDTAPDLNTDNWADTTDSAIGFISLNEGKDWDVLVVDIGWEGINYYIHRLNGSAKHYDRYLYTPH